ncbi:MAG: DUF1572 family protein [Sphingobacteriales bacterium]|nr:DUF1572 family protein [Sphingobacteriales bacterium]MBP8192000.1 DUF1572 family protein [Chitinophagales bacterium]
MVKEALLEIFERDLGKLKEEISLYTNENNLWKTEKQISNSGGNLALHLIGNLNHFIGATLGNTGYVRERDNEFSDKNIPVQKILDNIDATIIVVKNTLSNLTAEDFEKVFPLEKHGQIVKTDFMLLHLLAHLEYHLGQINYHRRLIE